MAKATHEIHDRLEGEDGAVTNRVAPTFGAVIVQILMLASSSPLDSVITAVGMVRQIPVMVAAVIIAMIFMLIFVNKVSDFIDRHPTIKMLALSFLILIGCALVCRRAPPGDTQRVLVLAEWRSRSVLKLLNIRTRGRKKAERVELHQPYR